MCDELMPIAADCTSVSGGIIDLYMAYKKDVDVIPAPAGLTGAIDTNITMKAGKYFVPLEFVDDNGGAKEDSQGDPGFGKQKTTISVVLKGQKAQVNRYLNRILNGSYVLIFTDAEDQKWVGGSPKKGFQLSTKKDWGTKGDDKVTVTIEFMLTSSDGMVAYNGIIPIA
jgi:hypothetical protein